MSGFSAFAKAAEETSAHLAKVFSAVAALSVAVIVVILVFSSLQRYVLDQPIPATEELAAYMFVACAFLSMMDGLVEGRHIRLLPVWKRLPAELQGWLMMTGHLGTILILVLLIRETFSFAAQSYEYGARSYVANLIEWPWMMIIPFSLTTLALAIFARLLGDLDRTMRGLPLAEAASGVDAEDI